MTLVPIAPRHVGWQTAEGVVASVHMQPQGEELVVVSLEYDELSSARALLDAVAAAATVPRLAGFEAVLAECDFVSDGERWVREVTVAPAPMEETRSFTLGQLEEAIRSSWSAETSDDPDAWTPGNPAFQHCDVTARVVQDYLGGEILVAGVARDGRRVDRHAWNRLPSGLAIDLTWEQFHHGEQLESPSIVERPIGQTFAARYEVFAARVRAKLHGT